MKKKLMYFCLIAFIFVIGMNFVSAEETANSIKWVSDNKYNICGINNVPDNIPALTSNIYNLVKILVPIALIVLGIVDFINATSASDLDKMKKAQKKFITRLLAGIFIFFIMAIVQFVFNKIDFGSSGKAGFWSCMDCLLNNEGCEGKNNVERRPCSERAASNCISDGVNDKGFSCTVFAGHCKVDCTKITSASSCNDTYKGVCQWNGEYNKGKCNHVVGNTDSNYYAPIKNNGDTSSKKNSTSNQTTPSGTTTDTTSSSFANTKCSDCSQIKDETGRKTCLDNCKDDTASSASSFTNTKCSDCSKIPDSTARSNCNKNCVN